MRRFLCSNKKANTNVKPEYEIRKFSSLSKHIENLEHQNFWKTNKMILIFPKSDKKEVGCISDRQRLIWYFNYQKSFSYQRSEINVVECCETQLETTVESNIIKLKYLKANLKEWSISSSSTWSDNGRDKKAKNGPFFFVCQQETLKTKNGEFISRSKKSEVSALN